LKYGRKFLPENNDFKVNLCADLFITGLMASKINHARKTMNTLLKKIGYNHNLESKNKYAYIVAVIQLFAYMTYFVFYFIFTHAFSICILTFVSMLLIIVSIFLLKGRHFYFAKVIIVLTFLNHIVIDTLILFPENSLLFQYFLLFPPAIFLLFTIKSRREIITAIVLCALVLFFTVFNALFLGISVLSVDENFVFIYGLLNTVNVAFIFVFIYLFYTMKLNYTEKELKLLAETDALTRIYNRRMFFDSGNQLFRLSDEVDFNFSLLLFDIDYFKNINDTYGHASGDLVLADFAAILKSNIRKNDNVYRCGGEEFAIIIRSADPSSVYSFWHKINHAMHEYDFLSTEGHVIKLTVSAGAVSYQKHNFRNFNEMISAADDTLYEAKNNGRNQMMIYHSQKEQR
jgi:diguanylate cyclase (GGDEF)-like protein